MTNIPPEIMAQFAEMGAAIKKTAADVEASNRRVAIAEGYATLANHRETVEAAGGENHTLRVKMPAAQTFLEGTLKYIPVADIPAFFAAYLLGAEKIRFAEDNEPSTTDGGADDSESDEIAVAKFVETYDALDSEAQVEFSDYREHFDRDDASDQQFVAAAAARFAAFDPADRKTFGPDLFAYTMRQYSAAHKTTAPA